MIPKWILRSRTPDRLSATYRDPVVVLIASVVLSAEPEDRVRPVLIPQQHFVVLALVHLGLDSVCGVPILEEGYVTLQRYLLEILLGEN